MLRSDVTSEDGGAGVRSEGSRSDEGNRSDAIVSSVKISSVHTSDIALTFSLTPDSPEHTHDIASECVRDDRVFENCQSLEEGSSATAEPAVLENRQSLEEGSSTTAETATPVKEENRKDTVRTKLSFCEVPHPLPPLFQVGTSVWHPRKGLGAVCGTEADSTVAVVEFRGTEIVKYPTQQLSHLTVVTTTGLFNTFLDPQIENMYDEKFQKSRAQNMRLLIPSCFGFLIGFGAINLAASLDGSYNSVMASDGSVRATGHSASKEVQGNNMAIHAVGAGLGLLLLIICSRVPTAVDNLIGNICACLSHKLYSSF